jgi:hypothetical protein
MASKEFLLCSDSREKILHGGMQFDEQMKGRSR